MIYPMKQQCYGLTLATARMKSIEYRLELCDITGEHRPIAVFRACTPFPSVRVGERFDDEGWPRLDASQMRGAPDKPIRFTVHSIKHVIMEDDEKITARYCLNLQPYAGDRSPTWGKSDPV
jgi:hypothetical protein